MYRQVFMDPNRNRLTRLDVRGLLGRGAIALRSSKHLHYAIYRAAPFFLGGYSLRTSRRSEPFRKVGVATPVLRRAFVVSRAFNAVAICFTHTITSVRRGEISLIRSGRALDKNRCAYEEFCHEGVRCTLADYLKSPWGHYLSTCGLLGVFCRVRNAGRG
jgi:hypothetical protein